MLLQHSSTKRWQQSIAGALGVAMLIASPPGWVFAHEGHASLPSTGATVEGDQVLVSEAARKGLGLKTATVTLQDLKRVLRVRTRVELPWHGKTVVTTLVPGHVQKVLVAPGQPVQAGQDVAQIKSLELERLQLAMLQAANEVAWNERLVEQRRPLAEDGAIAGQSLLETETQLWQKRVQLAIARRKLMALGVTEETLEEVQASGEPISSISVTSPIDGVVTHCEIRAGQFVDTQQQLVSIVDRSQVLLVGDVLETDVWQVQRGQATESNFAAVPDRSFAGEIDHLRLAIHPDQRTLEVAVPVDNPRGTLRPGMFGRMEITVDEATEGIVCPTAALIDTPEQTFVLLRQGEGKYQRREIKIGMRTPDYAEITEGLFPGDRVVVTGSKLLASLFHTKPPARIATQQQEASGSEMPEGGDESQSAIPLARAVVELPTNGKVFATPVIEGRIAKIHIQPGETVSAGQRLAELDSQQLRSLQLDLLETQEKLRRGQEMLDRVTPLAESGSFPKSDLWALQMDQRSLGMKLRNVERKLAMVGLSSDTIRQLRQENLSQGQTEVAFVTVPILAPSAGRVADFSVAPGEVVDANDVLFEIQDTSTVWLKGYVFEQDAHRVEIGQQATIRIPAYPKLQLTGRVVRMAPTLHASSRVLPVWIEVENPDQQLREGMLAHVKILQQSSDSQVALKSQKSK